MTISKKYEQFIKNAKKELKKKSKGENRLNLSNFKVNESFLAREVLPTFICSVCSCPFKNTKVGSECKHHFCEDCVNKMARHSKKCALCAISITKRSFYPQPIIDDVIQILNLTEVEKKFFIEREAAARKKRLGNFEKVEDDETVSSYIATETSSSEDESVIYDQQTLKITKRISLSNFSWNVD